MNTEDFSTNEVLDEFREVEEADRKKARILANLLDVTENVKGKVIALRLEMGTTLNDSGTPVRVPSFLATHSLRHLSIKENMRMGSEMPFMEEYISKDGKVIVDESNAAELAQRAPDWTRQPALTAYLVHEAFRKFGTILAVVSPPWVDDPSHENWSDQRALKSAINFEPIDNVGNVGLLSMEDINVYALDGQHRVMGIRGISDIIDGKLLLKKKDGDPTGKTISREDFLTQLKTEQSALSRLIEDRVAVEYLPAVVKGETRDEAARRVRSIFVSINSYAKKTDKGEGYLLDEADGYSIAGRKVGLTHPLFKGDRENPRVNWKNTGLPKRSTALTTLQAIRDMVFALTEETNEDRFESWKPKFKGAVPLRPGEKDIDGAAAELSEVLDRVAKLPSFQSILSGDKLDKWREFPNPEDPDDKSRGHLLLRPFGQVILVRAVGRLLDEGFSLDEIFHKLAKFDAAGGFEAQRPENVWYHVTYNPAGKMIVSAGASELAVELLVYLVRGALGEKQIEMLDRIKALRESPQDPLKWLDFEGRWTLKSDPTSTLIQAIQ
jgi:hypothetical protein